MVKMTSYDENIKKSKNFEKSIFSFFCSDGPGEAAEPPEPPESRRAARKPPESRRAGSQKPDRTEARARSRTGPGRASTRLGSRQPVTLAPVNKERKKKIS